MRVCETSVLLPCRVARAAVQEDALASHGSMLGKG